jgi:hypothetical protein
LLEKKASPMSMVGFPLLLIPLAICNIIVFLMPGLSFSAPLFTIPLMSGVGWAVTLSDVLVALGILMLLFEVIKGARPGAKYLTDHLLSLIVFGAAAAEFVLLPQFGTSTYFLLTLLALVDFMSGIALRTQRPRVASVATATAKPSAAATAAKAVPPRNEAPAEPRFDRAPAPAPSIPPSEPMIEPAPSPHIEPNVAHSEVVAQDNAQEIAKEPVQAPAQETPAQETPAQETPAHETARETAEETARETVEEPAHDPSPEIQSPGIQPGSGAHPSPDNPQR